jgi:hypothetical protein
MHAVASMSEVWRHAPGRDPDHEHVIATVQRIRRVRPDLPEDVVRSVVAECLAATRDARIQDYRVLLAERKARQRLAERHPAAPVAQGRV